MGERPISPADCGHQLRSNWCSNDTIADKTAVFFGVQRAQANDTAMAEQKTAEFLLLRGNWSWIGYDWNGCHTQSNYYPRPSQWNEDFGVPLERCYEVPNANASNTTKTGVFTRSWSKATVTWDCNAYAGNIKRGGGR